MVDAVEDHAIFTLDARGHVASWNRGAEKILGRQAAAILGRPLSQLYPADQSQEADRELAIARTVGRFEGETIRAATDERERFLNITTAAMRDERGALIGFARIVRDVTERRRSEDALRSREKQLRQAHKMEAVGQLAGGVAHDFNNMLSAIRGYTEVLLNDRTKDESTREALEEIRSATERAASLTRQLLAFSRKQVLQPRPVNPNVVVREMESMLRRLLIGDLELTTVLERDVGQITVDPAQLEQVLLNLVVNARDAMSDRGRIVIRTSNVELDDAFCHRHEGARPGPHVRLSVSDSGIGMSDDTKRHIFEPFFTTKKRGAGTGLGLSTVYGIVKQSGGYITLDSEIGHGSVFRVYFPRTQAPAEPQRRTPAGPHVAYRQGTVLLVDDEDSVRRVLAALIERLGYQVLSAADGIQALEVSRTHRGTIDLLITDIMMPRMHGRELSERLAKTRPETRVLFTSGYADDDIIERGLLDPRTAFIQKPFSIEELAEKMRATLAPDLVPVG
jgi:PAS domain S-box-containing protein